MCDLNLNIGFIGGGNMGEAMIGSLVRANFKASNIVVFAKSKNDELAHKYGVSVVSDEIAVVNNADVIVLAVKPNAYEGVLNLIKSEIKTQIIITLAPSFSIARVQDILSGTTDESSYKFKVVRTMPNTPALIGCGVTAVNFSKSVSQDERKNIMQILSSFGEVFELDESAFPAFVGIAGSLPAYVFMFIEALADGAVLEGLSRDKAYKIAAAAVAGSANMALQSQKHVANLKDDVCSPSGTSIEAVRVLENAKFRSAVIEAVSVAARKTRQ
ncbi:pyrroline-5-carboxylate reductase [Campylobacter sp. faydin G-24]|uniref:Pyrroline-5-carboxylate reductase n=1 Tax=Campylobacter anatolicus TaxID=2829105 RepID=A0ABS5HK37_9BACT|nr:pyrroline-5-carboxylate reductase [Campylobacter anatolicus]MBR8464633.1 pyrroline-5-carboxylate reductase [Campylobacter anatolicus]